MPVTSLRFVEPYGRRVADRVTMARGLAFLFAAGGTLVFITLALPHSANTNDLGVAVAPTLAFVVVGVLLARAARLPMWAFYVILATGAVLVSVCVRYGGDSADAYALMYVWVTLYAGYFFDVRRIVGFAVFCGVCYAVAQMLRDDNVVPQVYWLMAIGTASVASALTGQLTYLIRAQTADLAAVTNMANGVIDVKDFASITCGLVRDSTRADAVVLFETDDEGALGISGSVGSQELCRLLAEGPGLEALQECLESGQPSVIGDPGRGRGSLGRHGRGWAQPILRDGSPIGVLALAYERPRRLLSDRVRSAAGLFAAETRVGIERRERVNKERERHALEINDNIVQGLALAKYAIEAGDLDQGVRALDDTLERARDIITSQLEEVAGRGRALTPGDLVRRGPSTIEPRRVPPEPRHGPL
jgi:GAF domain-containing protein